MYVRYFLIRLLWTFLLPLKNKHSYECQMRFRLAPKSTICDDLELI